MVLAARLLEMGGLHDERFGRSERGVKNVSERWRWGMETVTSVGSRIGGGQQSDRLVTKVRVHQYRVEHKHNIKPWIVMENPNETLLFNLKQNEVNTQWHIVIRHTNAD